MNSTQFFDANEDEKKTQETPNRQYSTEEGVNENTEKEKKTGIDAATTFKQDQEQDLDDLVHNRGKLQDKKDKLNPDER